MGKMKMLWMQVIASRFSVEVTRRWDMKSI